MAPTERPKFLASYFEVLSHGVKKRGLWAILPYWLGACAVIGAAAAYFVPAEFWAQKELSVSATVYVGVLTLNGLMLALCWSAFAKIYEIIGGAGFVGYLRSNNLLQHYMVFLGFVHCAQVVAVFLSGAGLVVLIIDLPFVWPDQVSFGLMLTATIYAIRQAVLASSLLHDLIWQKSIYDDHVTRGGKNVVPLERK